MRIYLDGCDGVGKSTLAKYLSERFKLDIFCLTKDSEKSIDRYNELAAIENVVHDRTFLSEVVYPKIFRRDNWLTDDAVCELIEFYNQDDGVLVICTAPDDIIRRRILDRQTFEHYEVVNNIDYINSSYRELANKYNLLLVDTQTLDFDTIGDMIERRLTW